MGKGNRNSQKHAAEMVKNSDIGYAVANAVEELKDVADRLTVSVDDSAIARIIEQL